jgi:predicted transcriptional regulator
MQVLAQRSVLQGLTVQEAMRRHVIHLFRDASLEHAIRYMIKYKPGLCRKNRCKAS